MKKYSFLLSILIGVLFQFNVTARTINVSNTSELTSAYASVNPGDTILCAPATYGLSNRPPPDKVGLPGKPVVVKGTNRDQVIFAGTGEGQQVYVSYWTWEDIHFKGTSNGGNDHVWHVKSGCAGYLTWRNCRFSGVGDKAIKIDFAAYNAPTNIWPDYVLVENCIMEIGKGGLMNNDGSDYMTCRNNYTYGYHSGGVYYNYFSKGGLAYSVFENNLIVGGFWAISYGGGSMSGPFSKFRHDDDLAAGYPKKQIETIRCISRNNIIISATAGFAINGSIDDEVYNNTLINCTDIIQIQGHNNGKPNGLKVYNNLYINSTGYSSTSGITISNNKNLSLSPASVFVSYLISDYPNNNYRIKSSMESAVGKGKAVNSHSNWDNFHDTPIVSTSDYYGTPRTSPPTIGATEN